MTTRRSAMALLAAGVLPARLAQAQHDMHTAQGNPAAYRLQFFTPDEHRRLDSLTELILPANDRSGGVHAARVADFIDLVIANSAPDAQQRWRAGLASFSGAQPLNTMLAEAAREESAPNTTRGKFFVELKRMTIHAYYTSQVGLQQELGYKGPEVLVSFPGCR